MKVLRGPAACSGFSLGACCLASCSCPLVPGMHCCLTICSPIPDKPLSNMKILTLGKLSQNKDEVKAMIEKLGGKLTGTANKASLCISTKSESNSVCKPEKRSLSVAIVIRIK